VESLPPLGRRCTQPQRFIVATHPIIVGLTAGSVCRSIGHHRILRPSGRSWTHPRLWPLRAPHGRDYPPIPPLDLPAPSPANVSLKSAIVPLPISHAVANVKLDLQPTAIVPSEDPASDEALAPELQLEVAYEVLHCLNMVEKSRSLSVEELDLIEFLLDQVTLLSSSLVVEVAGEDVGAESSALPLAVEVTCEDVITESLALPPTVCEAVELQADIIVSQATPPTVVDAQVAIAWSSSLPVVALVL
jgi:hypothetical protein